MANSTTKNGIEIGQSMPSLAQAQYGAANAVAAQAVQTGSITLTPTANSIICNCTFPAPGQEGNCIVIYDFNQASTPANGVIYQDNTNRGNDIVTISSPYYNLTPGGRYFIGILWPTDDGSGAYYEYVHLDYDNTSESLVSKPSPSVNVITNFEQADMNYGSSYYDNWLKQLDRAYSAYQTLTGWSPGKMTLNSTRSDSYFPAPTRKENYWRLNWGVAGFPIWISQPFVRAMMMRLGNGDWGEVALHEMSHNFDKDVWNFDYEAMANFKEYYVVDTLGAKVYRCDTDSNYTGSDFYNFFKSDEYWSYDNTIGAGNPDKGFQFGLTAVLIAIKRAVNDWDPFKATFQYFNDLEAYNPNNVPTTPMGKFNLFISKLNELTKKDVIAALNLTAAQKSALENSISGGGTIGYVTCPQATPQVILPPKLPIGPDYPVESIVYPSSPLSVKGSLGTNRRLFLSDDPETLISSNDPTKISHVTTAGTTLFADTIPLSGSAKNYRAFVWHLNGSSSKPAQIALTLQNNSGSSVSISGSKVIRYVNDTNYIGLGKSNAITCLSGMDELTPVDATIANGSVGIIFVASCAINIMLGAIYDFTVFGSGMGNITLRTVAIDGAMGDANIRAITTATVPSDGNGHYRGAWNSCELKKDLPVFDAGAPVNYLYNISSSDQISLAGNAGDYGVTYTVTIPYKNSGDTDKTISVYLHPRGGSTYAGACRYNGTVRGIPVLKSSPLKGDGTVDAVQPFSPIYVPHNTNTTTNIVLDIMHAGAATLPLGIYVKATPSTVATNSLFFGAITN